MAEPLPAVPPPRRGVAGLGRRILRASAADIAPGGDTGWWRWLLPALVVLVVLFAALNVRWSTQEANRVQGLASDAGALAATVDDAGAQVGELAAPRGVDPAAARRLAISLERAASSARALQDAATTDPDQAMKAGALADQAATAGADVQRMLLDGRRGALAAAEQLRRDVLTPQLGRLRAGARQISGTLTGQARADASRQRQRLELTLVGGLLLAALLAWTFWARRSRAALELSERRFRSLVERSRDLVCVLDGDGAIRFVTPVVERTLGFPSAELVGTALLDLVHPDDIGSIDWRRPSDVQSDVHRRIRHRDGAWREFDVEWLDLRDDPAVGGFVVTMQDVSERQELRGQLRWQAFHDALTGLPNRALFENRVAHALERLRRDDETAAVLFIDLDDFKTVNDSLGHAPGDALLRAFALRLGECTRRSDTAARFGGDEFVVLVEGADALEAAPVIAQRIYAALDRPFQIDDDELFVHASIGIARGAGELTAEELIRNADIAMYAAKAGGKSGAATFEPSMHSAARKRLQLSGDLRRGVRDRQFSVRYQPLVRLDDGRMLGAEALVRWEHETLGTITPEDFIPLAEETGLIVPIGRFVLNEACRQLATWRVDFPDGSPDYVSVNLSVRQFHPEGRIVEDVRDATVEAGLDPSHLMLEVTESVLMTDREAIVRDLTALRAMGVRIAIDDFGTGYSALSYLRQFPIDTVKMDRSFIRDLGDGKADSALIRSVVELGEALNMQIVAEGVEGREQLESLTGLRCDIGQGYYFAPPLLAEEISSVLGREPARERPF